MKARKLLPIVFVCSCILLIFYTVNLSLLQFHNISSDLLVIDEDIDSESIDDESVFFIESRLANVHTFDSHQACSIESAAIVYPDKKIYVMFLTNTTDVQLNYTSLLNVVSSYDNVNFKFLNIRGFSKNTPLEAWLSTDKLQQSEYVIPHTSDALRLLTLWKFGGTYLDLDVIATKRLNLSNYACAEGDKFMNGAVLNLDKQRGKELASLFIQDFIKNFDGTQWGFNGPELITRVLKKLCNFQTPKGKCKDFEILPPQECYAIGYSEWELFFKESAASEVKSRTKDSHFIHLWNKFSNNYRIRTDSNAAFIDFAKNFCPKVYESRSEYF